MTARLSRHISGRLSGLAAALVLLAAAPATVPAMAQNGGPGLSAADRLNDYPTAARADYVFGCMASNGETREMLSRCACSIDVVASILPYEAYERAETVLMLRRTGGERMAMFQSGPTSEGMVAELRRAQAEAEILCF